MKKFFLYAFLILLASVGDTYCMKPTVVSEDDKAAFLDACKKCVIDKARTLLGKYDGALKKELLDSKDSDENTALHLAVKSYNYGKAEIAQFLLNQGADPNIINQRGESVLGLVIMDLTPTIADILLSNNYRYPITNETVNRPGYAEYTPLLLRVLFAEQWKDDDYGIPTIEKLLDLGADPTRKTTPTASGGGYQNKEVTPLEAAQRNSNGGTVPQFNRMVTLFKNFPTRAADRKAAEEAKAKKVADDKKKAEEEVDRKRREQEAAATETARRAREAAAEAQAKAERDAAEEEKKDVAQRKTQLIARLQSLTKSVKEGKELEEALIEVKKNASNTDYDVNWETRTLFENLIAWFQKTYRRETVLDYFINPQNPETLNEKIGRLSKIVVNNKWLKKSEKLTETPSAAAALQDKLEELRETLTGLSDTLGDLL